MPCINVALLIVDADGGCSSVTRANVLYAPKDSTEAASADVKHPRNNPTEKLGDPNCPKLNNVLIK